MLGSSTSPHVPLTEEETEPEDNTSEKPRSWDSNPHPSSSKTHALCSVQAAIGGDTRSGSQRMTSRIKESFSEQSEKHILPKFHIISSWKANIKDAGDTNMARRAVCTNVSFSNPISCSQPTRPTDLPKPPLLANSRRGELSQPQCPQDSVTPQALESQFCFLYLFMIQSASSMALLIICWILSGLSSSE